uniref:NADH-ubiquinone oxidoreductase chain 3 n=1 Tax=Mukaria splendida TaxID=2586309 RepID=A0A7L8ZV39_9HEMI|nr:NADH dehydrogenase subunit 3 [Mukaria splendida]QOI73921.1 NADH dehydrogenase subunit 3 [Mukaria splendida]
MKTMVISMMLIFLITMIITSMIMIFSKKSITDMQKSTPFECGFNPMSYNRLPFSIHFFMIAVIFLIFDIEIILIMPIVLTYKTAMLMNWLLTSIMFTIILLLGLLHEWNYGMLNWTK